MEAIIHPGMPKTGSSSIQATLMALKPEGWFLPDTPLGNMSGRFALFFDKNPHEHHSFKARGLTAESVEKERLMHFEIFEKKLRESAENGDNALFSAEYASLASKESVEKLAKLFQKYGFETRVIAYVRKPTSFMQSAFQQRLKANLRQLKRNGGLWPKYRHCFEKMDQIFGRENVELKLFDSNSLKNGDVCLDFFENIGISIHPDQVVRLNESMSLNACAFLFAQRILGKGFVQGIDRVHEKTIVIYPLYQEFLGSRSNLVVR